MEVVEYKTLDIVQSLPVVKEIKLYDQLGYVRLIDVLPAHFPEGRSAEIAIVRNARVSFLATEKTVEEDNKLIKYLIKHRHTSPFESIVFKFEICCPLFVERQLVRHRTMSINEASYRYSVAPDSFYFPGLRLQSKNNKQCGEDGTITEEMDKTWTEAVNLSKDLYQSYIKLTSLGVAREVARVVLPVALMTKMVISLNLHNLLHFLRLRTATDAQLEIRQLADAILQLIKPIVPITIDAYFPDQNQQKN